MDKHIELVKKSLADPSSVTEEELKANCKSAAYYAAEANRATARDAPNRDKAAYYAAAYYAAEAAADANRAANRAADAHRAASYYIKRCEELTNNKSLTDEENDEIQER